MLSQFISFCYSVAIDVQYIYLTHLSRFQKLLNKFGLEIEQHYKKKKINLDCLCFTHDYKLNK